MRVRIYAIEREVPHTTSLEEKVPIKKVGMFLKPDNFDDEIILEYMNSSPDLFIFKTEEMGHKGEWAFRKIK